MTTAATWADVAIAAITAIPPTLVALAGLLQGRHNTRAIHAVHAEVRSTKTNENGGALPKDL